MRGLFALTGGLMLMLGIAIGSTHEETPPLPQVAGWLQQYGWQAVDGDEIGQWNSAYPTDGATVARFEWLISIQTPALGVPPEHAEGLVATLRIVVPSALQDSFIVAVRAISESGTRGEWSVPGAWRRPDEIPHEE